MIPIPYSLDYAATLEGNVPVEVHCEKCGHEFVYFLYRKATGEGTSFLFLDNEGAQQRARERAEARLRERLAVESDPVPCAECGWYQEHMIPRARHLRYRWFIWAALGVITVVAILLAVAGGITLEYQGQPWAVSLSSVLIAWGVALLLGTGAIVWLVYLWKAKYRYDPNQEDVEVRKQMGQKIAMSKADFLELLKKIGRAEDRRE